MHLAVIFVLFAVRQSSAVIYRLNETEHAKLPALFELESWSACASAGGDAYCYVDAELHANETSALLTTIQEYSAYTVTHFDRRVVHRGLCTRSCGARAGPGAAELAHALEACLNDTLYRTHRLQTRIIKEKVLCTKFGEPTRLDAGDYAVAAAAAMLLLLAGVGSALDFYDTGNKSLGGKVVLSFSLRGNWRRLVAPSGDGPDPGLRRLKCFNGIKFFTTLLVILGHAPLGPMATTNNPDYFESTYHWPLFALVYNGTLIVQTFFLLSGFLLSYNAMRQRRLTWDLLPKGTLLRWLRLTPPYAAVLAFICTWQRHVGDGPLWKSTVEVEIKDCRRDWYYNLLYLNNYIDGSQCIAQSWYLGADMQLSVVGLAILCLVRSARARGAAVGGMLLVGLLAPALHTGLQNLNAILLVTPEVARSFFVFDPTFNNTYKRGHTNAACYALGLALGMLVHRLQHQNFDITKYKKYRILYWSTVPLCLLLIMSGAIFYVDGLEVPLAIRAMYSSGIKLIYGLCAFVMIGATIFKFDTVYRGIVEWRGLAAPARVSYCAYLVHAAVIRNSAAAHSSLVRSSTYLIVYRGIVEWRGLAAPARVSYCAYLVHAAVIRNSAAAHSSLVRSSTYLIAMNYVSVLTFSFLLALPCWLLLEAPAAQLVKLMLPAEPRPRLHAQDKASKETVDIKL